MEKEIWKDIDGDRPGYQVSTHGRVRSFHKRIGKPLYWGISDTPQRILLLGHKSRYPTVSLGRDRIRYVHQLVMETFVGPCPDRQEVCHNDGDSNNNHLSNLRYDTHKNNIRDACLVGSFIKLEGLTVDDIISIRQRAENGERYNDIAKDFDLSIDYIHELCMGRVHAYIDGPLQSPRQKGTNDTHLTLTPKRREQSLSHTDAKNIRDQYSQGATQPDLARQYGCSISYISLIVHNKRLVSSEPPKVRKPNYPKLTSAQRQEIGIRAQQGESATELAKEYGITRTYVYHLKKQRT